MLPSTLIVFAATVGGVVAMIRHGMTLWFRRDMHKMTLSLLHHVYDQEHDREDVEATGKAIALAEGRHREPSAEEGHAQLRRVPQARPATEEDAPDPRPAA